MFGWIKKAIGSQDVAGSTEERFATCWQRVEDIYNSDRTYSVSPQRQDRDDSDITEFRHNLDAITRLLMQEYKEQMNTSSAPQSSPFNEELATFTGPCFELLIGKEVVPLLAASAQTDRPPGVGVHTMEVLRQLIEYFGEALVPQEAIHKSINTLVKVMHRIVTDPQLTVSRGHDIPNLRIALIRLVATLIEKIQQRQALGPFFFFSTENTGPEFVILTTLLEMFFNGSEKEQDMCRPVVLSCLQFDSKDLCDFMCDNTEFVPLLVGAVCEEYVRLNSSTEKRESTLPKLFSFFNDCVSVSQHRLRNELTDAFSAMFLKSTLRGRLLSVNVRVAISATTTSHELLMTAPSIVDAVVVFLVDQENGVRLSSVPAPSVLDVLLQRISPATSPALSASTLSLMEVLLALNRPHVWQELIGRYISSGVFARAVSTAPQPILSSPPSSPPTSPKSPSSATSLDIAADILCEYLLGPSPVEPLSTRYSQYLVDAESAISKIVNSYDDSVLQKETVVSPAAERLIREAIASNVEDGKSRKGGVTCGPLLTQVFKRVELMLDQPYSLNIALTGVISRLINSLDPLLHTYFLNPYIDVRDGVLSLPRGLHQVLLEASEEGVATEDFGRRLENARGVLSGVVPAGADGNIEDDQVVFAIVVAQELAKEMCAAVGAKAVMRELYANLDGLYADDLI